MRISQNSLVGTLAISLPLWSGCAGKSADECIIGTQSCICYPNNSCDEPFVCNASTNVCMEPPTAGAAGNAGDDGSGGATTGGSGTTGENGAGISGVAAASETGGGTSTGGASTGSTATGGSGTGGMVGVGGESTGGAGTGGESAATGGESESGGMSSSGGGGGEEPTGGTSGIAGSTAVGGAAGNAGGAPAGGATTAGTSGEGGAGAPAHIPDDRAPCVNIGFIGEDRSTADGASENQVIDWLGSLESVNVVRIEATAPLTDELLRELHAIIVGNMQSRVDAEALEEGEEGKVAPYGEGDIDALTAWVEGGGGLLTLAGYTGDENAARPATELLSYMGLGYDYVGRGSGIVGEGSPPNVVSPVSGMNHRVITGVTQLGAYLGYPVMTDNTSDRVLIESGDFDLAVAHTQGEGRVLVYFDDWITLRSEWSNHTELQQEVFWRNTLNWLLSPVDCSLPR